MKIGDHIKVKDGIDDPDFKGKELSGYTGYIEDIDKDGDGFVGIRWDDTTLRRFDNNYIEDCEINNLDYTRMFLVRDEIELFESE